MKKVIWYLLTEFSHRLFIVYLNKTSSLPSRSFRSSGCDRYINEKLIKLIYARVKLVVYVGQGIPIKFKLKIILDYLRLVDRI